MSITRLSDGRFRVRVYLGYEKDAKGRERRKLIDRICANEKEAKRLEAQLREELRRQEYVPPTRLTVAGFLDEWLEKSAKPSVKRRTYERYKQLVEKHLKPHLGALRLEKLEPRHVDGMLADLSGKIADRTRLHVYRCLHRAMEVAVRWRLVGRNVCDAVEPPKADDPEMVVLSAEEIDRLLQAAKEHHYHGTADSRFYCLYLAAVFTGMREGELFGLRWEDLDLEEGIAHVRQTVEQGGKHPVFGTPKNRKPRAVPLPPEVTDALKAWKVEQEIERAFYAQGYRDFGLVFTRPNGEPLSPSAFAHGPHQAIVEKAKLPKRLRFHDLRHTFASRALAAGANVRAISEILGHHDPGFTLRVYSHVLATDKAEASEKLANYLRSSPKKQEPGR
ncbi:site-specific integrase [Carboxydochorda subterranea]|uniref:Site-specific integrase n=1 Tax=Carboxydichorda subterranea TaxID=3109565 RepID=A0ABZ1BX39_9FIRM|nr:site-specific integrase [Limnochorda sp. L945t]WRP17163.1 site-specific integrase [Limnochorda sp. L945t]